MIQSSSSGPYYEFIYENNSFFREAALRPAGGSMIAEIFDVGTRGTANGIFNWGVYLGIGLTFTLGNYVAPANILTEQGWRSAFVIGSMPGLLIAALMACLSDPRSKR